MSIGTTIKRLRRERDITQEQLAEYLGITSRAISQWECDRTSPDISQIPALCNIFNVSSDVLLGIDIEKSNEEIKRYLDEADELLHQGKNIERTVLLREANKRFPRDYKIMEHLADAIVCEYSRRGITEYDEVFDICKRILAECTDSNIRYAAINTLGIAYGYAGKKEELAELTEQMPRARFSYENFMVYRWAGNADLAKRREYINFLIHELLSMISCLSGHTSDGGKMLFSWKERKALQKLELDIIETLFPDGDYQYFAQYAEMVCSFFVSDAFKEKNHEKLWYWLDKGADFAIYADTYNPDAVHTSPILRGFSSGGWTMEENGNRSQAILEWLTSNDETEVLRSDSRYAPLVIRLKQVAIKP